MSTFGYDTPGGSASGGAAPGGAAPGSPAPGFPGGNYRQPSHDPTAVMGRRIGAWVIDALLFFLLMFVFSPLEGVFAKYERIPEGMSATEACEILQDERGVSTCVTVDEGMLGGHPPQDRVYYVEDWVSAVGLFAAVAWFVVVYVIWQGLTGATPGKTLLKLRVVDESGGPPGMGKSAVRSVMWIVDGAPWVVPLVGFVTGLTSPGHRRIGDRAAGTFVVDGADQGRPVPTVTASAPEPVYHSPQPAGPPGSPMPAMPPTAPPMAPPTVTEPVGPAPQPASPPAGPRHDEAALPPFEPTRPPFPQGGPAPPPTREPGAGGPAGLGGAAPPKPEEPAATEPGEARAESADASDPSSLPSWAAPPTRSPDPFGRPEPPETPMSSGPSEGPSSPAVDASGPLFGSPAAAPDEPAEPTAPTSPAEPAGSSQPDAGPEATEPPVIPVEPTRPPIEEPGKGAEQQADPQPTYEPQWDTARGAYIQWDPNRSSWLQWDDDAKEWHAIS